MDQKKALDFLYKAMEELEAGDCLDLKKLTEYKGESITINTFLKRLGVYLKRARHVKKITQTGLAEKCNSSIYMVSKLEKGNSIELDHFLAFMGEIGVLGSIVRLFEHHLCQLQKEEERSTVEVEVEVEESNENGEQE